MLKLIKLGICLVLGCSMAHVVCLSAGVTPTGKPVELNATEVFTGWSEWIVKIGNGIVE